MGKLIVDFAKDLSRFVLETLLEMDRYICFWMNVTVPASLKLFALWL